MCAPYPQVSCTVSIEARGKGRTRPVYTYEGTFVTRDGAVFVAPPATRRPIAPKTTRQIEKKMLAVQCNIDGNPRADPSVASRFVDLVCGIPSLVRYALKNCRTGPKSRSARFRLSSYFVATAEQE